MASTTQLVSQLQSEANRLQSNVNAQAQRVHVALDKIDRTVNNVARKIQDLRKMIIEGEERQQAHENVLRIEQQINEQLKSYQVVRRSVLGVIKDFDINLARGSTITQLSEELWMSSSRYWLSYAFIAISAWVQDNKEVCTNAVEEALRRDFNKTALFFCLLNLRFNKNIEAREWLYEYFGSVDFVHPPRETSLILRAYLYGVFGKDSQLDNFVRATVERWVTELNTDSSIATDLVEKYTTYVGALPTGKNALQSDVLHDHCETIKEMNASLDNAGRYKSVLSRVERLDEVEDPDVNSDFIKRVDILLEDLVNNPEAEELRLTNEKKFYETIMAHEGDVEAAKREYAVFMENNGEEPNVGEQMFRWVAYPDDSIDPSIQKFALQKTKGWLMDAVKAYDHNIKSTAPGAFKLKIDLWQDTTDGKDRELVKKGLRDKFQSEKTRLLVFTKPNVIMTVIAAVFLILGIVLGVAASSTSWGWYGYIIGPGIFVILFLVVIIKTVLAIKKYPQRIQRAEDTLVACLDAIDAYRQKFEELAAVKDDILKKLEYV